MTYGNSDPALTNLLTDFFRKWPDLGPQRFSLRMLAICLEHGEPDLRNVVKAWPELPEAIRVGIVAMVKAAMDSESATRCE